MFDDANLVLMGQQDNRQKIRVKSAMKRVGR